MKQALGAIASFFRRHTSDKWPTSVAQYMKRLLETLTSFFKRHDSGKRANGKRMISASSTKKITSLAIGCEDAILSDCRTMMEQNRFSKGEVDLYLQRVSEVLSDCRKCFGEEAEVGYYVWKRFNKVQLWMMVKGEERNPLEGDGDTGLIVEKALDTLVSSKTTVVGSGYDHITRSNIVTVASPTIRSKSLLKSPMLWGPLLGFVLGMLCQQLPEGIRNTIVDEVAKPIRSVTLGALTGVMGPVILVSMITAVSSMGDIGELKQMGFRVINRFAVSILSVISVGIVVTLFFYSNFGDGKLDIQIGQVVKVLLNVIPTDPISPLIDVNAPQLVVLGLLLGGAFLRLDKLDYVLKSILHQINEWIMCTMGIVMTVVPVIPFICVFITAAEGAGKTLLSGWEFIVASYVTATICGLIKLLRVSLVYKVKIPVLWRKLKPLILDALASANTNTMLKKEYEIFRDELGIKPEFSSFWIPLSQAMLNPRVALNFIIPPILILKYTDTPISLTFLVVLIFVVLELSLADPGTTGGWSVLFATFGLPSDFVGMFMAFKLFTANYNAAYGALQIGLEAIEAAHKFDAIDMSYLRPELADEAEN